MSTHSLFSPSASHRILNCPPSLLLCNKEQDDSSSYAKEGTDAHALCAYLVEKALGLESPDPTEDLDYYDQEMQQCAEGYAEFVMEEYKKAKLSCNDTRIFVEQKVDISRWVKDCKGTADCIILSDGTAQIIDFKYGLGVLVNASSKEHGGNPQLMCYCLGVIDMFDGIYDIENIKMTIYQPRKAQVDSYEMKKNDLLDWADKVLAPTAALAFEGKGEFKAGEHCQFCKVKSKCRKRAEYNLKLAQYDFEMPPTLEDYEIDAILLKADEFTKWIGDIKEYALSTALQGTEYEHFKIVEGRSVRKFSDEKAVAKRIIDEGFDPYEKKLLGITAMTGLIGKKKFEDLLGDLIYKPAGKPALVLKTDKRPEMKNTAKNDFKGA